MEENRVVSYLPLSHIAGLMFDVIAHIKFGHKLYFARPDALSGSLVHTLQWVRPTLFLAVPRVWEKMEERLKAIASTQSSLTKSIAAWAKGHATARVNSLQNNNGNYSSIGYSLS